MQLFGIDSELDRLDLRALRASPPGLARADRARRRVCAAALGQLDELLTASGAVSPASAPLPLYYALNQAGRAIAAAHEPDPQRWEPKRHGLSVGDPVLSLGATLVTPWRPGRGKPRNDSFSVMADAVGSSLLSDEVRLDELWAAAPGIVRPTRGLGASKPLALQLALVQLGNMPVLARLTDVDVGRLPAGGRTTALRRRLERSYPSTRSPEMRLGTGVIEARHEARLSWQTSSGTWRILDEVAPRFPGAEGAHYLMPGLGSNQDVLAPLMVWWAILYALSHVARYQPAAWTNALDPVRSTLAAPIEAGLAWIREVMPTVILHELVRDR